MSETTAALPGTPTQAELEQIRRYTRRDFAPEELYVFPAVLCDNQIDRDGERFSRDCLRELAELFVGVTGVFDHRASAEGQHARIFAARVVEDPSRPTNCGEPYTALRAEIYMPRNEKTAGLIAEIDAGGEWLALDFDGRKAPYSVEMLSEIDLAYAQTIHKAQGSEYRCVVLAAMPAAPSLMVRGVLYTALTRARELLIVVGDDAAIRAMAANDRQQRRYSGLRWRLAHFADPAER